VLLIASLPANDVALAVAAAGSGADMLKVHLNVTHRASGTSFGAWADERERIQAILDAVHIPLGVMPGSGVVASPADWGEMVFAGVEFFDIYVTDMPAWMWRLPVRKMPSISEMHPPQILLGLVRGAASYSEPVTRAQPSVQSVQADYLEASIVKPEDYGKPLTALDLANYRWLADCVNVPIVAPTQKCVSPDDVAMLRDSGVGGLMVGKIVTGDTVESIRASVAEFRNAIDKL
jgi:hypothetical protein